MHYRKLGKTNFEVSEVSLGAWQIGGAWGDVSDADAERVLHAAIENGINLIDTADVYGDGRSERFIAKVLSETKKEIYVATKQAVVFSHMSPRATIDENLTAFVERSLQNLRRDRLDLVQLHCPPTEVYYRPEVFAALDELKQSGQNSSLRCQCGKSRRSAESNRVPWDRYRADHLQHFPAAS